ncbi:MAG: glycosyltransferase, partial [Rhodocyclaceae bacterium]|nr:glycosyltransferase [Rhodocyclaceae bacterium]
NIDLVLRTFAAVKAARPDARMLFVGGGPLALALGEQHPGHIFAGVRHGEDLAAHYASADLFLFPSLTETFGNATAEALASGLGVVAYDCAAAGDLIDDGVQGIVVPPGDEAAYVEAAVAVAREPERLAALRARAPEAVAALDWERIHDLFADTLLALVAGHRDRENVQGIFVVAPD